MLSLFNNNGIPIGNLTSQIFANIYMNEFDQFVKHTLKVKYYARYTDDFVIVSESEEYLKNLLVKLKEFLSEKLRLELHPNKVSITRHSKGIDFLGYVVFPHHILVRPKTRKRMIKKLKQKVDSYKRGLVSKDNLMQSLQSYLGVLSHADTYEFTESLKNNFWFWVNE